MRNILINRVPRRTEAATPGPPAQKQETTPTYNSARTQNLGNGFQSTFLTNFRNDSSYCCVVFTLQCVVQKNKSQIIYTSIKTHSEQLELKSSYCMCKQLHSPNPQLQSHRICRPRCCSPANDRSNLQKISSEYFSIQYL